VTDARPTADLLTRVFPHSARPLDEEFVTWLYDRCPYGPGIEANYDEDVPGGGTRRIAHYALVPARYSRDGVETPFVFSLNACVDPSAQRGGYFTRMGNEVYERAAAQGIVGVVGVSNANSTPAVVDKLHWKLVGPMPVRVVVPVPGRGRGFEHRPVDAALLAGPELDDLAATLDPSLDHRWEQVWAGPFLRWRLGRPDGRYVLHVSPEYLAVSTLEHRAGLRFAVVLKVLPRNGAARGRSAPLSGAPAVAAACAHHRAPLAVYAGFNARVRVGGVPLPMRLRPSPLNLILKSLDPVALPQDGFELATFEFLDSDAY
jgi:GNAT superfamily N-acetyltransferase